VTSKTADVDSLKALDPSRPIREADIHSELSMSAFGGKADMTREREVCLL